MIRISQMVNTGFLLSILIGTCQATPTNIDTNNQNLQKFVDSELEVSLLSDDKKARVNLVKRKSLHAYSFAVEQKLDSANSNVTFATRDGLAGKTKLTLGYSYISPGEEPKPKGEQLSVGEVIEGTDDENVLERFSLFNVSFSHFKNDVSYYSISDEKRFSVSKDGLEANIGYSRVITPNDLRFTVGFTYQEGFERARSNKEKQICKNFTDNPNFIECFDAYLQPARKVEKLIPYFQITKDFNDFAVQSVQFIIKYIETKEGVSNSQEDTKNNVTFEVPVHVWSFWEEKLSAGVKFAYSTRPPEDEDKFNAGVFLTAPISVFD